VYGSSPAVGDAPVHMRTAPAIVVTNKIATSTIKKITTPGIHPGNAPMAPAWSVGRSVGKGDVGVVGRVGTPFDGAVVGLVGALLALADGADGVLAEGEDGTDPLAPVGALVG